MRDKFISYLSTENLRTLCYVSKNLRKLILKKFDKIYEVSTGFILINSGMK